MTWKKTKPGCPDACAAPEPEKNNFRQHGLNLKKKKGAKEDRAAPDDEIARASRDSRSEASDSQLAWNLQFWNSEAREAAKPCLAHESLTCYKRQSKSGAPKMGMGREACRSMGRRTQIHSSPRALRRCLALALLLLIFGSTRARAEFSTNGEVAGLKAQFVNVNGIRTRYYEMGEGEPMVLVHGGEWSGHSSANMWSKDIPLFAKRFPRLCAG